MSKLDVQLIVEILQRREPALLHDVVMRGLAALDKATIVEIQSIMGVELLDAGLGADGEPTQFGLELDDQIGALGLLTTE